MAHKDHALATWDSDEFYKFLVIKQNISKRVAGNYISRCRRIEMLFDVDLARLTKSPEAYLNLVEKIAVYGEQHYQTRGEVMIFTGTLRLALKKFALFFHGSKVKFPRQYRRIDLDD